MDAALITGVTALGTGVLGYFGARLQHKGESDRIAVEHDRLQLERARVDEELEAARASRQKAQVADRLELYGTFLQSAERAWPFSTRPEWVGEEELHAWWVEHQGVRRRIRILGSESVSEAARQLNDKTAELHEEILRVVRSTFSNAPSQQQARAAVYESHGEEHETLLTAFVTEARAEIASLD